MSEFVKRQKKHKKKEKSWRSVDHRQGILLFPFNVSNATYTCICFLSLRVIDQRTNCVNQVFVSRLLDMISLFSTDIMMIMMILQVSLQKSLRLRNKEKDQKKHEQFLNRKIYNLHGDLYLQRIVTYF